MTYTPCFTDTNLLKYAKQRGKKLPLLTTVENSVTAMHRDLGMGRLWSCGVIQHELMVAWIIYNPFRHAYLQRLKAKAINDESAY